MPPRHIKRDTTSRFSPPRPASGSRICTTTWDSTHASQTRHNQWSTTALSVKVGLDSLFVFFRYPKALWTYLRSTNLLERFIRELRRGTKVQDQVSPSPVRSTSSSTLNASVGGSNRNEASSGFAETQEELNRLFYPTPQNVTQNS